MNERTQQDVQSTLTAMEAGAAASFTVTRTTDDYGEFWAVTYTNTDAGVYRQHGHGASFDQAMRNLREWDGLCDKCFPTCTGCGARAAAQNMTYNSSGTHVLCPSCEHKERA